MIENVEKQRRLVKQTSEDFSAFIQWKCSQSPGVRLLALLLIGVEGIVYMVPLVTDSNQCLSPLAPLTKDEISMYVLLLSCLEFGRVDHA